MAFAKIALQLTRWAAAILILAMASSKLNSPEWLSKMGIVWLPDLPAQLLGLWLPWFEMGLSFAMMMPSVWRQACRIMSVLLLLFVPILVLFWVEGRLDCGCSNGVEFLPQWLSSPPVAIARNIAMAAVLWAAASSSPFMKIKFTFDLRTDR
jgi:hypothetical protein